MEVLESIFLKQCCDLNLMHKGGIDNDDDNNYKYEKRKEQFKNRLSKRKKKKSEGNLYVQGGVSVLTDNSKLDLGITFYQNYARVLYDNDQVNTFEEGKKKERKLRKKYLTISFIPILD